MEERFLRNIPAITEAEQALLRQKTVAVIGCGGLGGYLAEFLCRLGVGAIRMVDGDVFEETNLNRQLLAEPALSGRNKAEAAAERLRRIDPAVCAEAYPVFLAAENAAEILRGCDVVLDGLDSAAARKELAAACEALGIPFVFGAIGGWAAQAALCLPGDGLVHRLYPGDTEPENKSTLSFTPALCAAVQSSLAVRYLTGRQVESGKLIYADTLCDEFELFSV